MQETGIITYCIGYADSKRSKCEHCSKHIHRLSIRAGEISRKSRKEKKAFAKHRWWHLHCWSVPKLVTQVPIEQFRGFTTLKESDQAVVRDLIANGVGAKLVPKNPEETKDASTSHNESEVTDITTKLTGVQDKPKLSSEDKKASNPEKKKSAKKLKEITKDATQRKEEKKRGKTKDTNSVKANTQKAKVNKKQPAPKKFTLPASDQQELESIIKEIQGIRK